MVKPEDVLHILAEHEIIWAIVPNVTLSNDMLEMEFDAIDLPISEEVALCIAINGIWKGDRIKIRHLEVQHQDKPTAAISQATFKEKISLTGDSLFVRYDDYSRIEPLISEIANQALEHEPLSQNEPVPSKSGKQLILRKLWEQKSHRASMKVKEKNMFQVLRRPDLEKVTGLGRSSIYSMMQNGIFPQPIKLTRHSVGWLEHEVQAWLENRISATRGVSNEIPG